MTETQEQYKARILGYVAGRDPLALLAAAPDRLAALVAGLPDAVLDARPAPRAWSIREIVAHLADDELVGAYRIRLILSDPGTAIQAFDQDAWARAGRYAATDVAASLLLFRSLREANLRLLHALHDEEWERYGIHAERGRESLRDIAAYYAGHDLNHFAQIERLRAAAAAPSAGPRAAVDVRPVEPADATRWTAMRRALWPDESAAELAAETGAFFGGAVPTLEAVLVAVDPGAGVIGFAELSRRAYAEGCETSPVGFLEGWYVEPGHRGRGVGRALVAAAEGWARGLGCREFASDTTLENTAGAAAHRALGFEEVERLRCFRKALADEPAA